jgi:Methyltransferase domain
MDPHVAANRALWNEWTPIHVRSEFYDVEGWKSGRRHDLLPLLVDEVGDVAGKDLLHLQCHFGLDTLSWARLGARVTGADFSERAVEQARLLAADIGLEARFVVSDVVDLPDDLEGDFDVVRPWVPWKMFQFMVEAGPGIWRLPEPDDARLPVLYSLKATKA